MFDFALITERTETRVRDDLLGAGPKTVDELHAIFARLRVKYKAQLERRIERAKQQEEHAANAGTGPQIKDVVGKAAGLAGGIAVGVAGGLLSRFQGGGNQESTPQPTTETETPPAVAETPAATDSATPPKEESQDTTTADEAKGELLGADKTPAAEPQTEPASEDFAKFSIEEDDEEIM